MMNTRQLFISYRSTDAAEVDRIAHDLGALKHPDGITPRFRPWQDKRDVPPASPDWWEAIIDAISASEVFVFFISRASLESEVCRAELDYAYKRNRPIIPVVLPGQFTVDEKSGRYTIDYWNLMPPWLQKINLLWYTGAGFYGEFLEAIEGFERAWPPDVPAPRPLHPNRRGDYPTPYAQYDAACDYAERLAFSEAEALFHELIKRCDPDYESFAREWLELLRLYAKLVAIEQRPNNAYFFNRCWGIYVNLPRKRFFTDLFDPKGFARKPAPPPPRHDTIQNEIARAWHFEGKKWTPFVTLFPDFPIPDMGFCLVPVGSFMMGSDRSFPTDEEPRHLQTIQRPYWIAHTPVTNRQWQVAVKMGWVSDPPKQSDGGCQITDWYHDPEMADAPVVGISWFEALKFCQAIGCLLPSERDWEYAANGVRYTEDWWPNNYTSESVIIRSEEKSWVGAWRLVSHVWEWCSTVYEGFSYPYREDDGRENLALKDETRVLRGGVWYRIERSYDSTTRNYADPWYVLSNVGFRCIRLIDA